MRSMFFCAALSGAILAGGLARADTLVCVDENVGAAGWRMRVELTRAIGSYSGHAIGAPQDPNRAIAVTGRNGLTGHGSGGVSLRVRRQGVGFTGIYRDHAGARYVVRLICK